jgi:hypothetical protein
MQKAKAGFIDNDEKGVLEVIKIWKNPIDWFSNFCV